MKQIDRKWKTQGERSKEFNSRLPRGYVAPGRSAFLSFFLSLSATSALLVMTYNSCITAAQEHLTEIEMTTMGRTRCLSWLQ